MEELGPDLKVSEYRHRMNSMDSCSSDEPTQEQLAAWGQMIQGKGPQLGEEGAEDGKPPPAMHFSPLPTQQTIHEMVATNRIDKISKQLDKGVSVNVPDVIGETPLFWALSGEVVDYLVGEGADIEWRNTLCGCSVFFKFACQGKHKPLKALARHLKKAGKLSTYVNDTASLTKRTPLMAAAHNGYVETVKELLAMGADKSLEDYLGKTALDLAKANECDDVVALLE